MVIAGLAAEERISVEDKTPIFGDLPFVGRFFRSTTSRVKQKSIVFMVTAEVVDPSGEPIATGPPADAMALNRD
jgi:general secretion pathway protein D